MPKITPKIPQGLEELMLNLAKSIIRENPQNIYEYAAEYFEKLLRERDGSVDESYKTLPTYKAYKANKADRQAYPINQVNVDFSPQTSKAASSAPKKHEKLSKINPTIANFLQEKIAGSAQSRKAGSASKLLMPKRRGNLKSLARSESLPAGNLKTSMATVPPMMKSESFNENLDVGPSEVTENVKLSDEVKDLVEVTEKVQDIVSVPLNIENSDLVSQNVEGSKSVPVNSQNLKLIPQDNQDSESMPVNNRNPESYPQSIQDLKSDPHNIEDSQSVPQKINKSDSISQNPTKNPEIDPKSAILPTTFNPLSEILELSATKIQSTFRGYKVRKEHNSKPSGSMNNANTAQEPPQTDEIECSTVDIQFLDRESAQNAQQMTQNVHEIMENGIDKIDENVTDKVSGTVECGSNGSEISVAMDNDDDGRHLSNENDDLSARNEGLGDDGSVNDKFEGNKAANEEEVIKNIEEASNLLDVSESLVENEFKRAKRSVTADSNDLESENEVKMDENIKSVDNLLEATENPTESLTESPKLSAIDEYDDYEPENEVTEKFNEIIASIETTVTQTEDAKEEMAKNDIIKAQNDESITKFDPKAPKIDESSIDYSNTYEMPDILKQKLAEIDEINEKVAQLETSSIPQPTAEYTDIKPSEHEENMSNVEPIADYSKETQKIQDFEVSAEYSISNQPEIQNIDDIEAVTQNPHLSQSETNKFEDFNESVEPYAEKIIKKAQNLENLNHNPKKSDKTEAVDENVQEILNPPAINVENEASDPINPSNKDKIASKLDDSGIVADFGAILSEKINENDNLMTVSTAWMDQKDEHAKQDEKSEGNENLITESEVKIVAEKNKNEENDQKIVKVVNEDKDFGTEEESKAENERNLNENKQKVEDSEESTIKPDEQPTRHEQTKENPSKIGSTEDERVKSLKISEEVIENGEKSTEIEQKRSKRSVNNYLSDFEVKNEERTQNLEFTEVKATNEDGEAQNTDSMTKIDPEVSNIDENSTDDQNIFDMPEILKQKLAEIDEINAKVARLENESYLEPEAGNQDFKPSEIEEIAQNVAPTAEVNQNKEIASTKIENNLENSLKSDNLDQSDHDLSAAAEESTSVVTQAEIHKNFDDFKNENEFGNEELKENRKVDENQEIDSRATTAEVQDEAFEFKVQEKGENFNKNKNEQKIDFDEKNMETFEENVENDKIIDEISKEIDQKIEVGHGIQENIKVFAEIVKESNKVEDFNDKIDEKSAETQQINQNQLEIPQIDTNSQQETANIADYSTNLENPQLNNEKLSQIPDISQTNSLSAHPIDESFAKKVVQGSESENDIELSQVYANETKNGSQNKIDSETGEVGVEKHNKMKILDEMKSFVDDFGVVSENLMANETEDEAKIGNEIENLVKNENNQENIQEDDVKNENALENGENLNAKDIKNEVEIVEHQTVSKNENLETSDENLEKVESKMEKLNENQTKNSEENVKNLMEIEPKRQLGDETLILNHEKPENQPKNHNILENSSEKVEDQPENYSKPEQHLKSEKQPENDQKIEKLEEMELEIISNTENPQNIDINPDKLTISNLLSQKSTQNIQQLANFDVNQISDTKQSVSDDKLDNLELLQGFGSVLYEKVKENDDIVTEEAEHVENRDIFEKFDSDFEQDSLEVDLSAQKSPKIDKNLKIEDNFVQRTEKLLDNEPKVDFLTEFKENLEIVADGSDENVGVFENLEIELHDSLEMTEQLEIIEEDSNETENNAVKDIISEGTTEDVLVISRVADVATENKFGSEELNKSTKKLEEIYETDTKITENLQEALNLSKNIAENESIRSKLSVTADSNNLESKNKLKMDENIQSIDNLSEVTENPTESQIRSPKLSAIDEYDDFKQENEVTEKSNEINAPIETTVTQTEDSKKEMAENDTIKTQNDQDTELMTEVEPEAPKIDESRTNDSNAYDMPDILKQKLAEIDEINEKVAKLGNTSNAQPTAEYPDIEQAESKENSSEETQKIQDYEVSAENSNSNQPETQKINDFEVVTENPHLGQSENNKFEDFDESVVPYAEEIIKKAQNIENLSHNLKKSDKTGEVDENVQEILNQTAINVKNQASDAINSSNKDEIASKLDDSGIVVDFGAILSEKVKENDNLVSVSTVLMDHNEEHAKQDEKSEEDENLEINSEVKVDAEKDKNDDNEKKIEKDNNEDKDFGTEEELKAENEQKFEDSQESKTKSDKQATRDEETKENHSKIDLKEYESKNSPKNLEEVIENDEKSTEIEQKRSKRSVHDDSSDFEVKNEEVTQNLEHTELTLKTTNEEVEAQNTESMTKIKEEEPKVDENSTDDQNNFDMPEILKQKLAEIDEINEKVAKLENKSNFDVTDEYSGPNQEESIKITQNASKDEKSAQNLELNAQDVNENSNKLMQEKFINQIQEGVDEVDFKAVKIQNLSTDLKTDTQDKISDEFVQGKNPQSQDSALNLINIHKNIPDVDKLIESTAQATSDIKNKQNDIESPQEVTQLTINDSQKVNETADGSAESIKIEQQASSNESKNEKIFDKYLDIYDGDLECFEYFSNNPDGSMKKVPKILKNLNEIAASEENFEKIDKEEDQDEKAEKFEATIAISDQKIEIFQEKFEENRSSRESLVNLDENLEKSKENSKIDKNVEDAKSDDFAQGKIFDEFAKGEKSNENFKNEENFNENSKTENSKTENSDDFTQGKRSDESEQEKIFDKNIDDNFHGKINQQTETLPPQNSDENPQRMNSNEIAQGINALKITHQGNDISNVDSKVLKTTSKNSTESNKSSEKEDSENSDENLQGENFQESQIKYKMLTNSEDSEDVANGFEDIKQNIEYSDNLERNENNLEQNADNEDNKASESSENDEKPRKSEENKPKNETQPQKPPKKFKKSKKSSIAEVSIHKNPNEASTESENDENVPKSDIKYKILKNESEESPEHLKSSEDSQDSSGQSTESDLDTAVPSSLYPSLPKPFDTPKPEHQKSVEEEACIEKIISYCGPENLEQNVNELSSNEKFTAVQEEEVAAVKIQSTFRGYKVRKGKNDMKNGIDEVIDSKNGIEQEIDSKIGSDHKIDPKIGNEQEIDSKIGSNQEIEPKIGSNQEIDLNIRSDEEIDSKIGSDVEINPKIETEEEISSKNGSDKESTSIVDKIIHSAQSLKFEAVNFVKSSIKPSKSDVSSSKSPENSAKAPPNSPIQDTDLLSTQDPIINQKPEESPQKSPQTSRNFNLNLSRPGSSIKTYETPTILSPNLNDENSVRRQSFIDEMILSIEGSDVIEAKCIGYGDSFRGENAEKGEEVKQIGEKLDENEENSGKVKENSVKLDENSRKINENSGKTDEKSQKTTEDPLKIQEEPKPTETPQNQPKTTPFGEKIDPNSISDPPNLQNFDQFQEIPEEDEDSDQKVNKSPQKPQKQVPTAIIQPQRNKNFTPADQQRHVQAVGTHQKNSYNAKYPKMAMMRQKTMPVQIESNVMRILPTHLRKRIKSAEGEKKKRPVQFQ